MKSGIQLHEQGTLRSISTFTVSWHWKYFEEFYFKKKSNFIEYTKSNQRAADLLQQNGLEFVQILLKVRVISNDHP